MEGGAFIKLNPDIVIDLYADFAGFCGRELQTAGYVPPVGAPAEVISAYSNVRHRRVSVRPRTVHKAATWSVPPHLAAGELAFLAAVSAGNDLRPYQSTLLERHDFDDGMLNDFGIQHFHLGVGPHPTKPGFNARSEPVLVAIVRDDDFYVLDCLPHGAWTQQSLLDVAHGSWPTLLTSSEPSSVQAQMAFTSTDADIKELRKHGINATTQRPDQTIHASPGGGSMLDKGSARVARSVTQIKSLCDQWERIIEAEVAKLKASGVLTVPVTLHLDHRGREVFVVGPNDHPKFKLGQNLLVPPL
jgi:hypothetical protein